MRPATATSSRKPASRSVKACNPDLRSIPDDLAFPYAPKEVCKEKPSQTTTNFNFLNRALTHTKVNCTWDEPETDNRRNEILFKDGFEDKIDLEDYLAPGIEEGVYEDESGPDGDGGVQSAATSSEEEEPEDKPQKKLVTSGGNSTKANSLQEAVPQKPKSSAFADFDKSKKKAGQLKIVFQNPLESKLVEDDNPLGKRVYSMKYARKHRFDEEEQLEDNADDFFEDGSHEAADERAEKPAEKEDKVKLKFKERMKEKKKQAKLEKERKRNELREQREERLGIKSKQTEDLELLVGEQQAQRNFRANYSDDRFTGAFEDPDMAIDTTSTMFKKDKHSAMLFEKKKRRTDGSGHN